MEENSEKQQKELKKNQPITAKTIVEETDTKEQAKKYTQYVENKTPKPDLLKDMLGAFVVGGALCTLGQCFTNFYQARGYSQEDAASYTTISLILFSVLLTGCNLYQKLTKFGGAGSLVPITGFANSVAAPAIEFQKEGQVYGIGCKIFTIAGPVILFGMFSSWILGIIYWVLKMLGMM